jgi:DNA gyrase subunit A
MGQDEKVQAIIDTRDYETEKFLLIMTEKGTVKKSKFKDFDSNYKSLQAIKLKDGDKVVSVKTTSGKEDIILVSQKGQAIRFDENNLKAQGRSAMGVRGIQKSWTRRTWSQGSEGYGSQRRFNWRRTR